MKARASLLASNALVSCALSAWTGLCNVGWAQGTGPSCAGAAGAVIDAAIERQVNLPLQQVVQSRNSSASVVVFVRDGQLRFAQAAGFEDPEHRVPVTTAQSRFSLSSVSKTFIAISLAQLKLAGRIHGYGDAANDYLRTYHLPAFGTRQITLRELATHTSGLDKMDAGMMVLRLMPEDAVAHEYRGVNPLFFRPPGDIKSYSGFGMDVLGLLISDISGMPYGQYVQTKILNPLGMSGTIPAYPTGGLIPHEVKAFDPVQMRILKPPKYSAPLDFPADGTFTTGDDMGRYLLALLGTGADTGPITQTMRHELFTVQYQDTPQGSAHALVFEMLRARGHTLEYHMGVASNICMLAVVPDEGTGLFFCLADATHKLDPQHFARPAFDVLTRGCDSGPSPSSADPVMASVWREDWNGYLGDFVSTYRQHFGPGRLRDVMHPAEVPIMRVERGRQGLRVNGVDGLRELSPGVFGNPGGFELFSFYRDTHTGRMLLNSSVEATAVFEHVGPEENPALEHLFLPALVLITASGLLWPLWPRARRHPWAMAGAVLLGLATFGQVLALGAHPWDRYMLGVLWPLLLMRLFGFATLPAAALLSAGAARAWRNRPAPHTGRPVAGIGGFAWAHLLVLTGAAWLTVAALVHLGMIGFLMR